MAFTITAANSSLFLSVFGVFSAPQRLQGYGVDDAFASESVSFGETPMGVDGNMSVGYTPVPTKLKIVLMPDSPSIEVFDQWANVIKTQREMFVANATIILPSTGKKYNFTKGALTGYTVLPDVKKVLQQVPYEITFQDCSPALR